MSNNSNSDGGGRYTIDDFAFIGRTFDEYCQMFALDIEGLDGRSVLDCPAGACSFVSEARRRGITAMGADTLFDSTASALNDRCLVDINRAMDGFDGANHRFRWEFYEDVDDVRTHREQAAARFVADYARNPDRYVAAKLPSLPFEDDSFSTVLSAHLLFLYDDRLSYDFHRETLNELARVAADQVRVYPLVGFGAEQYSRLEELCAELREDGHRVNTASVPFEFLRGANEMLVVEPDGSPQ